MSVYKTTIPVSTRGEVDLLNITDEVAEAVQNSDIKDGIVTVFVAGSTGAITTIEYEPGLLTDFPVALERLFPKDMEYQHHLRWHDGNGHSHVRAALLKPDLFVPFSGKRLLTGTWQQIVFVELDTRPRHRKVEVTIMGE